MNKKTALLLSFLFALLISSIVGTYSSYFPYLEFKILNDDISNQTIVIDDYTFYLLDSLKNDTYAGYTFGDGIIWIKTDVSYDKLLIYCNHEVLHNIFRFSNRTYEEELIQKIQEDVDIPTCNRLIMVLGDRK